MNAIAFIKHEIEESAFGYHERYRTEQDVVVGVNRYVEEEAEVEDTLRVDPEIERGQVERLRAVKAERDGELAQRRLAELRRHLRGHGEPDAAHPRRAGRPLLGRRGVRRDARGLRLLPARQLSSAAAVISLYNIVLWIHVTAVVGAFGLTLAYPLLMSSARQGAERALPSLHWLIGMWGARLVSIGGLVVLAAGLYLASTARTTSATRGSDPRC